MDVYCSFVETKEARALVGWHGAKTKRSCDLSVDAVLDVSICAGAIQKATREAALNSKVLISDIVEI